MSPATAALWLHHVGPVSRWIPAFGRTSRHRVTSVARDTDVRACRVPVIGVSGRSPDQRGFVTIPDSFRNCLTNPYLVQILGEPARRSPRGRIAVAGRGIDRMAWKHSKLEFVGIPMALAYMEALHAEAAQRAMTMSERIRRRITGQGVTSRIDQETAASIDLLGRVLKYLYPRTKGGRAAKIASAPFADGLRPRPADGHAESDVAPTRRSLGGSHLGHISWRRPQLKSHSHSCKNVIRKTVGTNLKPGCISSNIYA